MTNAEVVELVGQSRIVAILRGDYRGAELEIVSVLAGAGIRAIEVTLNSPEALRSISLIATRFGSDIAVGAGTVLLPAEVREAAAGGASFIVSPNRDTGVIETTKQMQMASFPGCLTPTEIVEAMRAGADAVKLFPARLIDLAGIADLRAPLDGVRLVPTGGITAERARAFIDAGAWAVGVGSALVSDDVMRPKGLEQLAARAAAFVAAAGRRATDAIR